jgi:hypothetical protein
MSARRPPSPRWVTKVRELDLSEFHKADAGATCLALLV